jgi:hypothetical protein
LTQQIINIGAAPGDGSGDPLRVAFSKINLNFTELYNSIDQLIASGANGNDYGFIVGINGVDYGFITDPATIFLDYGSV